MFRISLSCAVLAVATAVSPAMSAVLMPTIFAGVNVRGDADRAANTPEVNPRWLMRLDREDRALIDELIGYAAPDFTDDLKWVGTPAQTWKDMHGKVVVIQSWNTEHGAARTWPARAARATDAWRDRDVVVIALHTPEGADDAEEFVERRPQEGTVVIDSKGAFCDAIGAYKTPVNVVVDRAGTVRYAGLSEAGLTAAVAELVEEKASDLPAPKVRAEEVKDTGPRPDFPPITGSVSSAKDVRGKRAPDFYVQQWITKKPDIEGKVVIIDFWATWCGPCVAAIPHMSEIQQEFANEVAVIGISSETHDKLVEGVKSKNLRDKINYTIAIDPSRKMSNAIEVKGIPHVVVLDSDWIVRWQGNPHAGFSKELVKQIVAANGGGGAGANPRLRWTGKK